jgi:hypothetical protein
MPPAPFQSRLQAHVLEMLREHGPLGFGDVLRKCQRADARDPSRALHR